MKQMNSLLDQMTIIQELVNDYSLLQLEIYIIPVSCKESRTQNHNKVKHKKRNYQIVNVEGEVEAEHYNPKGSCVLV